MDTNTSNPVERSLWGTSRVSLAVLVVLLHSAAILSIHYGVDFSSIGGSFQFLVLAYVWATISITAVWTVVGKSGSIVWWVPLTGLLLACEWILMMTVIDHPYESPEGPGWVVLLATQYISLLGMIWCVVQFTESRRGPLKFSLRRMLYCVALFSVFFGCFQWVGLALGWTHESLAWKYFFYCPILGAFNAIAAITVIVALASESIFRKVTLGAIGVALAALLGELCFYTLRFVFGDTGGLESGQLRMIMAAQAVCVWVTVLPYWRWAR